MNKSVMNRIICLTNLINIINLYNQY